MYQKLKYFQKKIKLCINKNCFLDKWKTKIIQNYNNHQIKYKKKSLIQKPFVIINMIKIQH